MYKDDFKEFVKKGITEKYFIGTGNPNAQVLIIGKESAIPESDYKAIKWYNKNATDWHNHTKNGTCEILDYAVNESNHLYKNWGKNTWSKYQKLNDKIFKKESKPYYVDFLKTIFTTEINDSPNKNTSKADKTGLTGRKQLFKNSDFIQGFPVVVLACSNYIKNNDRIREIDDVFNVTYDGDDFGKRWYSEGNWFYVHHNGDRSKLVIHTRQLSANVNDDLLTDIGTIIRDHLLKIGIIKAQNANIL